MRLLLVEDETIIRKGIKSMVQKFYPDWRIDEAANGLEALKLADTSDYDIALIDINMPNMNGLELAKELQDRVMCKIVISGFGQFGYAVEMMQYGVMDYLLKPVDREQLKSALDKAVLMLARSQSTLVTPIDDAITTAEKINKALSYIEENYAQPIDMTTVSEHVDMNYYVFSQIFKRQVGINFVRHLRELRIEKAKHMLSTTNSTIKQIASAVGYADDKVFSKVFKTETGVSPRRYQQEEGQ